MSSSLRFKVFLRDLSVSRLWSAWTRGLLLSAVVKRCKRDRSVRDMLHYFRQNILRPRRTLVLSATAAYKSYDDNSGGPPECGTSITEEDLAALLLDLDGVEELSKLTLFCEGCSKRVLIDKKYPGVVYCQCKDAHPPKFSDDGWIPYMEADEVIIWRKEYKRGQGLYAYKVYGRFPEVSAQDFAAVQVDADYRLAWDKAVAALRIVERGANGIPDQAVLHWEVLWPRLFANRDYVYLRRHKEFDVKTKCSSYKDTIFTNTELAPCREPPEIPEERPSVHSNAKRKAQEAYAKDRDKNSYDNAPLKDNKVYVIVSKSCTHPRVPASTQVIRVTEYWSHMVIKTLEGTDKVGMEFVLTYYDEPAVGGLPTGVAAWATGRAAPAYLTRMRAAAKQYRGWLKKMNQELPPFTSPTQVSLSSENREKTIEIIREEDMESSKHGPDMYEDIITQERSTQTDIQTDTQINGQPEIKAIDVSSEFKKSEEAESTDAKSGEIKNINQNDNEVKEIELGQEEDDNIEGDKNNSSWWRYLYPFYYFV